MPKIFSQKILITVMLITGPGVASAQGLNLNSILNNTKEKAQQAREKLQDCSENFIENVQNKVGSIQKSLQPQQQVSYSSSTKILDGIKNLSPFKKYICSDESVKVWNSDFKSVNANVSLGNEVKVFQVWNSNHSSVNAKVDGESVVFKKVEVMGNDGTKIATGYVDTTVIKGKLSCPYFKESNSSPSPSPSQEDDREDDNQTYADFGLGEDDCCIFPTTEKPLLDFTTGERKFGAGRSGGRKHAASDLYRNLYDPIRAIQDGEVVQDLRYFYDGTYSVVVLHKGGFLVRYGEVSGRRAPNFKLGAKVKKGQIIGYAGKLSVRSPMLHFELFNGTKTGALTNGYGSYQRRSDLMNPEDYLLSWLSRSF